MDMFEVIENFKVFKEKFQDDYLVFLISVVIREGFCDFLFEVVNQLEIMFEFLFYDEEELVENCVMYMMEDEEILFNIICDLDGVFVFLGDSLECFFKMIDFFCDEFVKCFVRQMCGMGVDEVFRECGVKDGDIIWFFEFEFEFID